MLLSKFIPPILFVAVGLIGCSKTPSKTVETPLYKEPVSVVLDEDFPDEVSGLADSYSRPASLWLIEDSKNGTVLIQLNHQGERLADVTLTNTTNRDWEDLAIGPGPDPSKKYLYIAEIGDNAFQHTEYAIYRVEEPSSGNTTAAAEKIRFTYSDELSHNAEAILLDPTTRDVVIVTKEKPSLIFKLEYPYKTDGVNIAEKIGATQLETVTGGAVSPNGDELLIRTYSGIHYWKKAANETLADAMKRSAVIVPSVLEPQGESIGFRKDGKGFFTLSETGGLPTPLRLYFYEKN